MSEPRPLVGDRGHQLVALYDSALPDVYGYLAARCGSAAIAEDLTSETFLAAVDAVRRDAVLSLTTPWLITVARNKLVDHWRRQEREKRALHAVADPDDDLEDGWDIKLDALVAQEALAGLGGHHRGVLTLRYVDGLPVREVADLLGRTIGATEQLLIRAKAAFRSRYEGLLDGPRAGGGGRTEEEL